jgi:hypothetical protein
MKLKSWFPFPDTIDEANARMVASVCACCAIIAAGTGWVWLLVLLWAGFLLRVAWGPKIDPLAQVVTKGIRPRLAIEPKPTAGTPKRFAQGIGVAFTTTALSLTLLGYNTAAVVVLLMLAGAATLEAVWGICLGCKIYGLMVNAGWVKDPSCVECADISLRVRN